MKTLVAFVMAALIACPGLSLAGDADSDAQVGKVKGSKSNSSERVGAGESDAQATTVKSGKSNSSDRVGAGAGASEGGVQQGTTVKSSKSNSSE